jgi:hypothetical protein
MKILQLGFPSVVYYITYLLALGASVRGNAETQPADLPTAIVPPSETTPSRLSRNCLLNGASAPQILGNEFNDLLDENLHNGTLALDFSPTDDHPDNSSAVVLLGHLLSPEGDEITATIREIIIPWAPSSIIEDFEYWNPEHSYNESQLLDLVAKVENLKSFRYVHLGDEWPQTDRSQLAGRPYSGEFVGGYQAKPSQLLFSL